MHLDSTETIRTARLAHPTNRQSSVITEDDELIHEWEMKQKELYEKSREIYEWALSKGVAKEVARSVLPQATKTRLYMSGTIRSFIHYIKVRTDPTTQLEHRNVAIEIATEISKVFPQIMNFVASSEETKSLSDGLVKL